MPVGLGDGEAGELNGVSGPARLIIGGGRYDTLRNCGNTSSTLKENTYYATVVYTDHPLEAPGTFLLHQKRLSRGGRLGDILHSLQAFEERAEKDSTSDSRMRGMNALPESRPTA